MPRKNSSNQDQSVTDYRHSEKRKNNPPAGLAGQGKIREVPKTRYYYDPHLPPVLRFDPTGEADQIPELVQIARQRPLTPDEAKLLANALQNQQPWLEWSGKREKSWFDVDPVALHIHERISSQAILKLAQREPLQRSLFADPELDYREAIQFYQHDVDWSNRLILGDSLSVMNSLAKREDLAGKVQMIYIDPPYGIKYASNFQPTIAKREVRDKNDDLTREAEQVNAYRDTWTLGIHSYLDYLRDRLVLARELLIDSGCIFIQINSENSHLIASLLDEVFGKENFIANIIFRKKSLPLGATFLETMHDHIFFYAKDKNHLKFRHLYELNDVTQITSHGPYAVFPNGEAKKIGEDEFKSKNHPKGTDYYRLFSLIAPSYSSNTDFEYDFEGNRYFPPSKGSWVVDKDKLDKLTKVGRLQVEGKSISYRLYYDDFPYKKYTNFWLQTAMSYEKIFAVQTTPQIIERCMLMTTDPGDLVLDPTCGSGTTAYVAEQWGRRWITIDTSRVALALARQRLLTAKYDYYKIADPEKGLKSGFEYKAVPHVTLKAITQNQALDPIFAKWESILQEELDKVNAALEKVSPEVRSFLSSKLISKERKEGKSSLTNGDRRKWLLPVGTWQEWEVPFESDPDYPNDLKKVLDSYHKAWRNKMDEVNAAITASAPQEVLVDQPTSISNVLRVSGPFTVEGVQPIEETLNLDSPIGGEPEELQIFSENDSSNAEAYLEKIIRLLKQDGVRFPDNKVIKFSRLDLLPNSILHAEGEWEEPSRKVGVSVGPQYGPVTAKQVEECIRTAFRRGYDDLVFAGFSFDGAAQAIIQDDANPDVRCHLAHIRPDVNMGDLLKDTPSSQLFTVFGLPRVRLEKADKEEWVVVMEGVDIYDPVNNTIQATKADKVAAWFLDSDYDGRTFCVTQAFFPDSTAWEKIAKALKTSVDPERFAAFSGTRSLPFTIGENKRVAVKVIDPRGNEAIRIMTII